MKYGWSSTRIVALMCEWMWQYTFTMPGLGELLAAALAARIAPRSNVAALESEKTLWKIGSSLGNSTVDPRVTASDVRDERLVLLAESRFRPAAAGPRKATSFR